MNEQMRHVSWPGKWWWKESRYVLFERAKRGYRRLDATHQHSIRSNRCDDDARLARIRIEKGQPHPSSRSLRERNDRVGQADYSWIVGIDGRLKRAHGFKSTATRDRDNHGEPQLTRKNDA